MNMPFQQQMYHISQDMMKERLQQAETARLIHELNKNKRRTNFSALTAILNYLAAFGQTLRQTKPAVKKSPARAEGALS